MDPVDRYPLNTGPTPFGRVTLNSGPQKTLFRHKMHGKNPLDVDRCPNATYAYADVVPGPESRAGAEEDQGERQFIGYDCGEY